MEIKDLLTNSFVMSVYKKITKETDEKINEALRFTADLQEEISLLEGPVGPKGDRGETGLKGDKGDTGERGETGPKGDKGDAGVAGEKGDRGDPGELGPQGDSGLHGEKGEQGDVGPIGPQGVKGEHGVQGIPGVAGPKGDKGDKGDKGNVGAVGQSGPQGERGAVGPQGETGPKGDKGDTGPAGKDGVNGISPDITPLIEKVDQKLDSINVDFSAEFKTFQDDIDSKVATLEKVSKKDAEAFKKGIESEFSKFKQTINNRMVELASRPSGDGGNSSGGGSYSILDNRDVEKTRLSQVEGDSILVYQPDKKKFVPESFLLVLERLKAELEVQYDKLVDFDGTYTYIGEAIPGTSKDQPLWRIKRIEEFGSDKDMDIRWADGSADQIHIWDNRATYTY